MDVCSKLAALLAALTMLVSGGVTTDDLWDVAGGTGSIETPADDNETDDTDDEATDDEWLTAIEMCEEITIGWNLGNTLDATGGSGMNTETSWGCPKATEDLILAVKDAGFNAVRIPITWYKHMNGIYEIDDEWMNRVQEVVDYAYHNDMYVIINAHHEDWHFPSEDNKKEASRILDKLWTQVAERFKDYGTRLIFEGMNEPRKIGTSVEWNGGDNEGRAVVNHFNQVFVDAVRATGGNNAKRCLMVPTYAASSASLNGFVVPEDDNIIVSVHAYTPYNFAMNTGNGATDYFAEDDKKSTDELKWLSAELNERFIKKGIGVIIGECGATDKGNLDSRMRWAKYFPAVFRQYGIPVFLWDNNSFGTGGEKYGLIHRSSLEWEYPKYIEALVKSAK